MKIFLFIVFISNILLTVSSQIAHTNVFKIQSKGCENGTLNLDQCGYYCKKPALISKNYDYGYQISFFTDSYCKHQGYYEHTNQPFIIEFGCTQKINYIANGFVICSNLEPKYNTFRFLHNQCSGNKAIPLGVCTSICDSLNIMINYDPFEYYSFTSYSNNDCSGIGDTKTYGSSECINGMAIANNSQNILCFESYIEKNQSLSSSSSILNANYTLIVFSIILIFFIFKN